MLPVIFSLTKMAKYADKALLECHFMKKPSVCVLLGATIVLAGGCATAYQSSRGHKAMSEREAFAAVKSAVRLSTVSGALLGVRFERETLSIEIGDEENRRECQFHLGTQVPEVYRMALNDDYRVDLEGWACEIGWLNQADAFRFVDGLYSLNRSARQRKAPVDEGSVASFHKVAMQYRGLKTKPTLPENARRYKVQAKVAFEEKSYDEATELYGKALDIAPWWPEGRYNRALLFAQQGRYGAAITEMKKYLDLVPDASNSRMAQDRIYAWERKASSDESEVADDESSGDGRAPAKEGE